ncbi:hypothetical protein [Campylobacter lari]|uniref:hypothetical protein n=1 Tax=Campylobacter lari TaxID=201 RepID=UPI00126E8BCE|nr:hypothetical protein [Campylobacter lari]EFO9447665.1 hypothetical protein [Campylobacter lari]MBT0741936.1 hypothetical protein [Campylobacter lari]MBT0822475.1 hypothetical protein [Campylobacter lari]MBT0830496.1 hypothetical protein [Campylobacter lari]MCR6520888.1 hypothetical protein [Campylobacter lari]
MASIANADDLCKHFSISEDCKIKIHQLYNTHKDDFLRPCIGIFYGIKQQNEIILNNECEYPKDFFCVRTEYLKIIYKKEDFEIINIDWIDKQPS